MARILCATPLRFTDDEESSQTYTESSSSSSTSFKNSEEEDTSYPSSLSSSLESLANFIRTNLKSQGNYSQYATSYITPTIPDLKIFPDETDSFTAEQLPFKKVFKIPEFKEQETRRRLFGKSSRYEKLINDPHLVAFDLGEMKKGIGQSKEDLTKLLFYKSTQWCEINKALAVDQKYPKISSDLLRKNHSKEHDMAYKKARKVQGSSNVKGNFKQIEERPCKETKTSEDGKNKTQQIGKADLHLREQLSTMFDDIKPIPCSKVTKNNLPWQFLAKKTATLAPKPIKKPPFKRTEYPPKTREDKIAELRKRLPPPKPSEQQTDELSGIWEPELMIDEFLITPMNYDSRLEENWSNVSSDTMENAKVKCRKWLESIPDNL